MLGIEQVGLVFLGALLASAGWIARRYISGSHKDERAARIERALDLSEKLKRSGMNVDEAKALADQLVDGRSALSSETPKNFPTLVDENANYEPFSPLYTTAAMGVQLSARLEVLNAEISELFLKLEILCGAGFVVSHGRYQTGVHGVLTPQCRAWRHRVQGCPQSPLDARVGVAIS